jgi:Kef-type K+ transport system membrane component KefB
MYHSTQLFSEIGWVLLAFCLGLASNWDPPNLGLQSS